MPLTFTVCPHEKCKEKRAVHMANSTSFYFSCAHIEATRSFSDPYSAKNMTHEDIVMYKCDSSTKDLLLSIKPPLDFRHIVQITEHFYVVFTARWTVNPTGYCHIQRQQDGHWLCSNSTCNRITSTNKQIKSKKTCLHLHVLFCILKLSLPDFPEVLPVPSTSSSDITSKVQSSSSASTSVGRMSTV